METTHTMAGLLAHAGAARVRVPAPVSAASGSVSTAMYGAAAHPELGNHQANWISGALAKPATFVVFDRKTRPTRPLSELSP